MSELVTVDSEVQTGTSCANTRPRTDDRCKFWKFWSANGIFLRQHTSSNGRQIKFWRFGSAAYRMVCRRTTTIRVWRSKHVTAMIAGEKCVIMYVRSRAFEMHA